MDTELKQQRPSSSQSQRQKIDRIDDQIHDLLMRRWQMGEKTGRGKRGVAEAMDAPRMRPAREAEILRRIVARHEGTMPVGLAVRIWREVLAANIRAQASYKIHVYTGDQVTGFWDLARICFGSAAAMAGHASAQAVLHACADDPLSVGVVPMPESAQDAPGWWSQLTPAGHEGPRVIAKLPFLIESDAAVTHPPAFAIGAIEQEESGDDSTLLMLDAVAETSLARLQTLLKQAGLEAQAIAVGRSPANSADRQVLLLSDGFVGREDARLAVLVAAAGDGILRAVPVGGFANPIRFAPQQVSTEVSS